MLYAEVIYETGSKSVIQVSDLDELKAFVQDHQNRAINGESGGPGGHTAERVKSVKLYDEHPGESDGTISADKITQLIADKTQDGRVNFDELVVALRDEVSPVHTEDAGRHESIYKAQETQTLTVEELI